MKIVNLLPYCPLPADQGSKVEMLKHLDVLCSLGECTVASAGSRPVGMGWSESTRSEMERRGARVVLREDLHPFRTWRQVAGLFYAVASKALKLEKAFGHANPYHRFAFQPKWWQRVSQQADLVVINYSYWAWLPSKCAKVIILHDLLSDLMWGGNHTEAQELLAADLVVVISKNEEEQLRLRGVKNILWSPPLVQPANFPASSIIGIVGSANLHNREGLRWLQTVSPPDAMQIRVHGALSQFADFPNAIRVQSYIDPYQPYRDCGIILLPTAIGTGVQIKAVEALACGRAIVARRGAMRGIPKGRDAWIEVDSPEEMWLQAKRLVDDEYLRNTQGEKARMYYQRYLHHEKVLEELRQAYSGLIAAKSSEAKGNVKPEVCLPRL